MAVQGISDHGGTEARRTAAEGKSYHERLSLSSGVGSANADRRADRADVDVSGIEPTAHATLRANVMRDDRPAGKCLERDRLIANAPAAVDDAFVRVPAVIEEDG